MKCKLYLAADSGGSKTLWRVCDVSGIMCDEYTTKGLGAVKDGLLPVGEEIEKAYEYFRRYDRICGIFLSLGGVNTEEVKKYLNEYWKGIPIVVEREACGNAILRAAMHLEANAVVMCGTGSVAVGNTKKGRKFCGGWGPVYGDEGSGGGIGSEALKVYLRSVDGLCDAGGLKELFSELGAGINLSDFYGRMEFKRRTLDMSRRELASLAPKIYELAVCGDSVCMELYKKAAYDIAVMANAVCDYFGRVLLCGGFFTGKNRFLEMCEEEFSRINDNCTMIYDARFSPIVSSVLAVLEHDGVIITEEIFDNAFNSRKGKI